MATPGNTESAEFKRLRHRTWSWPLPRGHQLVLSSCSRCGCLSLAARPHTVVLCKSCFSLPIEDRELATARCVFDDFNIDLYTTNPDYNSNGIRPLVVGVEHCSYVRFLFCCRLVYQ